MHSMPDNNSPSTTMNVRRLCSSRALRRDRAECLISSRAHQLVELHIFPVETPSATRIATVSGRCSSRLWHSTQVALAAGRRAYNAAC